MSKELPSVLDLSAKNKSKNFYTVVKRNGTLVPFHRERIFNAIKAAFRETKKLPKDTSLEKELKEIIENLTDIILKKILKMASKGTRLTVEGIQDMVEVTLMKNGYHDVAKDYIIYRDHRKSVREESLRNLKIYRHDRATLVRFNPMKITATIEQAFLRSRKISNEETILEEFVQTVNLLTEKVVKRAKSHIENGNILYFATIQDFIEQQLMEGKFYDVAKDYILYRAEKEKIHAEKQKYFSFPKDGKEKSFQVTAKDQSKKKITESQIKQKIAYACHGYEKDISLEELFKTSILNFYEGMKEEDLDLSNIMAARAKIEKDPAYSYVAAKLLLDCIYRETLQLPATDRSLEKTHQDYFKKYIKEAIKLQRISPELLSFDLDELAQAMDLKRDHLFTYLGLQTLYDRYFIHHEQKKLETPQIFWMRVAMGLSIKEEEKNKRAIEFYHILSQFYYTCSTPTLFNAGTMHPQLSSCYLSTIMDDLHHIFKVIADDAQLSKWAGGLGNDWTNVRSTGSTIKGTNGKSQGVIPFLKVANDTAVAVNQCFSAETLIYTAKGLKSIYEVSIGDLVLGKSGFYREVTDKFVYNQQDPMLSFHVQHALGPISVTTEHPFYACHVPKKQSTKCTSASLKSGKIKPAWIEAKNLQKDDYIAQVIPKEVVKVEGIDSDEARLYGILLIHGHLSKQGLKWKISRNLDSIESLEFVHNYLKTRGIRFWENEQDCYIQTKRQDAVRDGTTDRFVNNEEQTIPFSYHDLYDHIGKKRIAPRLSHLPKNQTLALVQALMETGTKVSRDREIIFSHTSLPLIEGLRYQLLRLGIPASGKSHFHSKDHSEYDLHIPITKEIAKLVDAPPATEHSWFIHNEHLFTRIEEIASRDKTAFVCDLKVETDESYMTVAALAHNGGKRKGAMCAYLETWHLDIEDFLELRKNTGDERRRTPDMNTANWIPDLFMKRVKENASWTLFSPCDVTDLHDLYGKAFETRYLEYEKMAKDGKIKLCKKVDAFSLWRKMLSMLFETGHPWITFKDAANIRSPQDHVGVVHSSNLCTEILLNTSKEETAVCNLGSVNLTKHIKDGQIDEKQLAKTIRMAIRMLDNVIDINFYPIEEAKAANIRHRPIGLGIMGFQDVLYHLKISYASPEAVEFADQIMEMISYYAILSSTELAKEKGTYSSYKGSKWDRGILPIDTIDLLEKERGGSVKMDKSSRMDWDKIRKEIRKNGMRNSNTMAIAPTATIANITGVTQSIEPMYKHLFVKSNLSGEFTIINPYLVEQLKEHNLWDEEMVDDLKYFDGSIAEIERIPEEVKKRFPVAFEIEPEWLIECASRRQKWIDMGQSLNLYLAEPSGKKLSQMYMLSWEMGLKTNYYLRSLGATQIEKSSMDVNKRGIQPRWMKNKSASSNIKVNRSETTAPVCRLEEGCESCQ